jgi:hypothetical protein
MGAPLALAAIPSCTYATSASFGRFGSQAWAIWQLRHAATARA